MLCLSRKLGEEIIIGDNIRVSVIGTKGSRFVIAVDAPLDVPVDRVEIRERKDASKKGEQSC